LQKLPNAKLRAKLPAKLPVKLPVKQHFETECYSHRCYSAECHSAEFDSIECGGAGIAARTQHNTMFRWEKYHLVSADIFLGINLF
jgi:hypothetical protein